jgi:uncharacterized protein (DUF433 family)
MSIEHSQYVRSDPGGAMKVGASDVSLDSLVAAWRQGHSPETIQTQYPSLTLEDVYGAIAWMLGHAEEVDAYLKRQEAVWAEARARIDADPSPAMQRLRATRAAGAARGT